MKKFLEASMVISFFSSCLIILILLFSEPSSYEEYVIESFESQWIIGFRILLFSLSILFLSIILLRVIFNSGKR